MSVLANAFNPLPWIIVAVAVLLIFGGQKIPELMRGLGAGTREFKKGLQGEDDELRREREREEEIRRRVEKEMLEEETRRKNSA